MMLGYLADLFISLLLLLALKEYDAHFHIVVHYGRFQCALQ